jgi:hypothetical protein
MLLEAILNNVIVLAAKVHTLVEGLDRKKALPLAALSRTLESSKIGILLCLSY